MVKETAVKKFRQLKINKLYRVTRHKGSVAAVVNDSKCSPQNSKSGKAQHVENEKKRLQVEDHAGVDKNQASFDTIDNQECVIKLYAFILRPFAALYQQKTGSILTITAIAQSQLSPVLPSPKHHERTSTPCPGGNGGCSPPPF